MAAASAAFLTLSCQERETSLPEMTGPGDETGYTIHTFGIRDCSSGGTTTRSVLDADTEEIKNVCAFAFDAESGKILRYKAHAGQNRPGDPVMIYTEGETTFEWALPLGVEMDIYAVCNMGKPDTPDNLAEFLDSPYLVYEIDDIADLNSCGIPMTAVMKGIKEDTDGGTHLLSAERIISKYSLKMYGMPSGYRITGIRICNVNSRTTLFASDEAADISSNLIMGDWATEEDLAILNSGGRAEFFMFENAQSTTEGVTLPPGSRWFEVHGLLGEAARQCTYLDIISEYNGSTRRDRMYLGRDCVTNFDVIRNTVRNITCPAPVSVTPGAGQDALEFGEVMTIGPGQTKKLPFSYNLSLSETGSSSISFTTDSGLTPGTPSFTDEGSYCGTGAIPVTCSSSATIGDRLKVQMNTAGASAQTELEVVNAVISVTISAPMTILYGHSMQLSARAVYSDGTTVTDPSLFVWHLNNENALITDGLLSRNGDAYGSVRVRAEHGGVLSNWITVSITPQLIEMLASPDPVNLLAGETMSSMITFTSTDVRTGKVSIFYPTVNSTNFRITSENPSIATGTLVSSNSVMVKGNDKGNTVLKLEYLHQTYGYIYHDLSVIVGDYSYSLELSESSQIDMKPGEEIGLKVWYVTSYKGTEESRTDVSDIATWYSNDPSVASVSKGEVTAVSPGNCNVTASFNGYKDVVKVIVHAPAVYELVVTPAYLHLAPDEGMQLNAYLYTVIDGVRDIGTDVTEETAWTSLDNSVASVGSNGYVTAEGEGSTSVRAEYLDYDFTVNVEVEEIDTHSNRLMISPSSATVEVGASVSLNAVFYLFVNGRVEDFEDVTSLYECVWTSSDESIAEVTDGLVTGVSEGSAVITADYDGYSSNCIISVGSRPISYRYELVIEPSSLMLEAGKTGDLHAIYRKFADDILESETDVSSYATWSTTDRDIASVSKGSVSAKTEGYAVITASYDSHSAEAEVEVSARPISYTYDLVIEPSSLDLEVGGTGKLSAIYRIHADGEVESETDVTEDATWKTSDDEIASIIQGRIAAKSSGSATITASYKGCSATAHIDIRSATAGISHIKASPSSVSGYNGDKIEVSVNAHYTDGSVKDISESCTWSSSMVSVASYSSGLISCNGSGSAVITFRYEGYETSVDITVSPLGPDKIAFDSSYVTLEAGQTHQVTVMEVLLNNGNAIHPSASDFSWKSSNTSCAAVSEGLITGVKAGSATVTGTYTLNGISVSKDVSVTVTEKKVTSLSISGGSHVSLAGSLQLKAVATYSDGSTEDVTSKAEWYSADGLFSSVSGGRAVPEGKSSAGSTGRIYCCFDDQTSDYHSITVVNDLKSVSGWTETTGSFQHFGMQVTFADGTTSRVGFDWIVTNDSNPDYIGDSGSAGESGQGYSKGSYSARIHLTSFETFEYVVGGNVISKKAECDINISHGGDNL